jgi:hypothetical protein
MTKKGEASLYLGFLGNAAGHEKPLSYKALVG